MDSFKKYLAYFAIIAALASGALIANALMKAREYGRDEYSAPDAPRASPGELFAKPRASGPMNAAELAWLMRERITLDVMERMVFGGLELDEYNRRVSEYNDLASSIEYRESDMSSAERVTGGAKLDIVSAAVDETMTLTMPLGIRGDESANVTWRAQKYLRALGYYPGPPDGKQNEGTLSAVKKFELWSDIPQTGRIDENLAGKLREAWIARNIPASVGLGR
jgi:hypothetical protein